MLSLPRQEGECAAALATVAAARNIVFFPSVSSCAPERAPRERPRLSGRTGFSCWLGTARVRGAMVTPSTQNDARPVAIGATAQEAW